MPPRQRCWKPRRTCGNCRKARAPSSSRRRVRQPTRRAPSAGSRNHLGAARSALADRRHHRLTPLSPRRKARARCDSCHPARHHRAFRADTRARTHSLAREGRHAGHARRRRHRTHLQGPGAIHRERSGIHALLLAHGRRPLAPVFPGRGGDRRFRSHRRCPPAFRSKSRWTWPRRERRRERHCDHRAAAHAKIRQQGRGGPHRPRHPVGAHLRFPRAEWLRQVHHAAHALRHAAAQRRARRGVRPLGGEGRRSNPAPARLHAAEVLAVGRPHHRREPAVHGRSIRARR